MTLYEHTFGDYTCGSNRAKPVQLAVQSSEQEIQLARNKLFVSFDFDNDQILKEFVIEQARRSDSPFDVQDVSLREAAPQKDWEDRARAAIGRADKFMVMLGSKTATAPGVLKEVQIAIDLGKSKFQIIGYKGGSATWAVPNAGTTYEWNWDNLKRLLA